jgi:hypothetical protein
MGPLPKVWLAGVCIPVQKKTLAIISKNYFLAIVEGAQ